MRLPIKIRESICYILLKLKLLNMENIERKRDSVVEENMNFFFDIFKNGNSAAILIDTLDEVKMQNELGKRYDEPVMYFDLSKIHTGDYERILGEIQADESKAVLFYNIDKIPKVKDYWLIEQMVKDALRKEESVPNLYSSLKRTVDFAQYHVGARCENWPPEYLEGVSLMAIPTELRKDYVDEDENSHF